MTESNRTTDPFHGQVFLITGSGHGMGAALARAVAAAGTRIAINCRADQRRAEVLAEEAASLGATATLVCRADVTDAEQARHLVEETVRAFGRIDVLVNTVGTFLWRPVTETTPAEWKRVVASNLDSVYHMCHAALPHMRRQHAGRIISLGAVGAERTAGYPAVAAYSAAKAGVVAFSKALALEEARSGITVNVVCPGVVLDDGDPAVTSAAAPPGQAVDLGDRIPVGRTGRAEDVVRAVLFFASPAADFVTGQVLAIAGGWQL